jgi:hypothetical protein
MKLFRPATKAEEKNQFLGMPESCLLVRKTFYDPPQISHARPPKSDVVAQWRPHPLKHVKWVAEPKKHGI